MADESDAQASFEARLKRMHEAQDEATQLKEANKVLSADEAQHRANADDLEARLSPEEEALEEARDELVVVVDDLETHRAKLQNKKAAIEQQLIANQESLTSLKAALSKAEKDLEDETETKKVVIRKARERADDLAGLREGNEAKIRVLFATDNTFGAEDLHEIAAAGLEPQTRVVNTSQVATDVKVESVESVESLEPPEHPEGSIVEASPTPVVNPPQDTPATSVETRTTLPKQGEYLETFPNVVFIGDGWWLTECPLCHANRRAHSKELFHGIKPIMQHIGQAHGKQNVDKKILRDRCKVLKYSDTDVARMRQGQQPTVPIIATTGNGSHRRESRQDSVLQAQDPPVVQKETGPASFTPASATPASTSPASATPAPLVVQPQDRLPAKDVAPSKQPEHAERPVLLTRDHGSRSSENHHHSSPPTRGPRTSSDVAAEEGETRYYDHGRDSAMRRDHAPYHTISISAPNSSTALETSRRQSNGSRKPISVVATMMHDHEPGHIREDNEFELFSDPALTRPKKDPSIIHPRFPTTIQINGRWHEIWCGICGTNSRDGLFLQGIAGLRAHVHKSHPEADLNAVHYWRQSRELHGRDVYQMWKGLAPKHTPISLRRRNDIDESPRPSSARLSPERLPLPDRPLSHSRDNRDHHKRQRSTLAGLSPHKRSRWD